jgi:hypothetical protein
MCSVKHLYHLDTHLRGYCLHHAPSFLLDSHDGKSRSYVEHLTCPASVCILYEPGYVIPCVPNLTVEKSYVSVNFPPVSEYRKYGIVHKLCLTELLSVVC